LTATAANEYIIEKNIRIVSDNDDMKKAETTAPATEDEGKAKAATKEEEGTEK
jgi:hypothetical protein